MYAIINMKGSIKIMRNNRSAIYQFIIGAGSIFNLSGNYFNLKYNRRFYLKEYITSCNENNKAFLEDSQNIRNDFYQVTNKLNQQYSKY